MDQDRRKAISTTAKIALGIATGGAITSKVIAADPETSTSIDGISFESWEANMLPKLQNMDLKTKEKLFKLNGVNRDEELILKFKKRYPTITPQEFSEKYPNLKPLTNPGAAEAQYKDSQDHDRTSDFSRT